MNNFTFIEELMSWQNPLADTNHAFGSLGLKYHNGEGWRLLGFSVNKIDVVCSDTVGNILEDIKKACGETSLPPNFKEDVFTLCQEVLEERIPKGIYGKKEVFGFSEHFKKVEEYRQLFISQAISRSGLVYDIRISTDRKSGEPFVCLIRFKENQEDIH